MKANRNTIQLGNKSLLVSYSTPVAVWIDGSGPIARETRYSVTTQKHITQWLAENGSSYTSKDVPRVSDEAFLALI